MSTDMRNATSGAAHGPDSVNAQGMPGAAGLPDVLCLYNGGSAPLTEVPVLSFSVFSFWIYSLVHHGGRVISFFAVPAVSAAPVASVAPVASERAQEATSATVSAASSSASATSSAAPAAATPPGRSRLYAVIAAGGAGRLFIAASDVDGHYPSLTPRVPQLHLFEREIYEKYGIMPDGHPWLKPVRFSKADGPAVGDMEFYRIDGDEIHEVAVGPIHAGVIECGHFRFQCLGEQVLHLEISLGYHHRGVEALLQKGPDARTLPLMEAIAGDSTIAHSWAYCTLVENLCGRAPLPTGQLVRALALELERLANHTGDMGAIAGDVGFLPTLSYCGRLRGDWLNMSAMLCGSRFGRGLLTPGGTRFTMNRALALELKAKLLATARDVEGALACMWASPSVMARLAGIGQISQSDALSLGLVGPAARACGIQRDARHRHPLEGVPEPPLLVTEPYGDVRSRAAVRHAEITASVNFCTRLLDEFIATLQEEVGEETAGPQALLQQGNAEGLSPSHLAISLVEGWRGEVCHVAITDEEGRFAAYSVTDPSFHNWIGLALALRGQQISDFPVCNKSFNLSYCGHDL